MVVNLFTQINKKYKENKEQIIKLLREKPYPV